MLTSRVGTYIHGLADVQIYRHAAQHVGLLARREKPRVSRWSIMLSSAFFAEKLRSSLSLIPRPCARRRQWWRRTGAAQPEFRPRKVVVPEELHVPDARPLGLAFPDPEAQVNTPSLLSPSSRLHSPLGVVHVPGRDQAARDVHRQQEGGSGPDLLDVYISGGPARRNGPKRLPGDRLFGQQRTVRVGRKGEPSTLGDFAASLSAAR